MRSRQQGRSGSIVLGERRARFVSMSVKGRYAAGRSVLLEPLAGVLFAKGNESSVYQGSNLPETLALSWHPGLTFGIDVPVGSARVAVVPGIRFAFTGIPGGEACLTGFAGQLICQDRERAYYPGHYPRWTQRPSISLRLRL